jgi:hypothetical protein
MVLVPLQAKLGNGKPDNAVGIDRKAVPLHQDVEQGQCEAEAGIQRGPRTMAHLLEVNTVVSIDNTASITIRTFRVPRRHSCMFAGSPALA